MKKNNLPKKNKQDLGLCGLPEVPERQLAQNIHPNRLSLVRYQEKKWVNYTTLHYYFMDSPTQWKGSNKQKQAVREAFQTWKELGIGLSFAEVNDATDAEIRIGFEPGGSWSYVGRDAIDLVSDPSERTMNFGWDLTTLFGRDTALHEIGHALGFPHEHQNPNAGIVWDESSVYEYFAGPPNFWPPEKTRFNVIRKISPYAVEGSAWDKNSIMHYSFKAGLIQQPAEYQTQDLIPDPGLSEVDIREVLKFYPGQEEEKLLKLEPFKSVIINIAAGQQLDFEIKPTSTRNYQLSTFGSMDTVMVLFEDINGNAQYLDGDDDSGYHRNSKISVRLLKNRTYKLRIRLYYSSAKGQGAVMIW